MDENFNIIMSWLRTPLLKYAKSIENFDCRYPATTLQQFQQELKGATKRHVCGHEDEYFSTLLTAARDGSIFEQLKQTMEVACKEHKSQLESSDRRYSLIMKLVAEADAKVPLISTMAFYEFNPLSHHRRMCEPLDLLIQASAVKGEARARALVRAVRETVEMLYVPYLRTIWMLTCYARKEWPKFPKNFGSLVSQAIDRLKEYPGLVELKAAFYRNAASHANWNYIDAEESLVMRDINKPPLKISINELNLAINRMYTIAGPTMYHVVLLYINRNFITETEILDALAVFSADLCNNDEVKSIAAETEMMEHISRKLKPLKEFVDKMNQASDELKNQ